MMAPRAKETENEKKGRQTNLEFLRFGANIYGWNRVCTLHTKKKAEEKKSHKTMRNYITVCHTPQTASEY